MIIFITIWSFFVVTGLGQATNPDFEQSGSWTFTGPGAITNSHGSGNTAQSGTSFAALDAGSSMSQTMTAYRSDITCTGNSECPSNQCDISNQFSKCVVAGTDLLELSWWIIADQTTFSPVDFTVSYIQSGVKVEILHLTLIPPATNGWLPYNGAFQSFQLNGEFELMFEVASDTATILIDDIGFAVTTPPPMATDAPEDDLIGDLMGASEEEGPIPGLTWLYFSLIIVGVFLLCTIIFAIVCAKLGMCGCCPCGCCEANTDSRRGGYKANQTELADLEANNDFSSSYGKKW